MPESIKSIKKITKNRMQALEEASNPDIYVPATPRPAPKATLPPVAQPPQPAFSRPVTPREQSERGKQMEEELRRETEERRRKNAEAKAKAIEDRKKQQTQPNPSLKLKVEQRRATSFSDY